jgi:hypothetical protein
LTFLSGAKSFRYIDPQIQVCQGRATGAAMHDEAVAQYLDLTPDLRKPTQRGMFKMKLKLMDTRKSKWVTRSHSLSLHLGCTLLRVPKTAHSTPSNGPQTVFPQKIE